VKESFGLTLECLQKCRTENDVGMKLESFGLTLECLQKCRTGCKILDLFISKWFSSSRNRTAREGPAEENSWKQFGVTPKGGNESCSNQSGSAGTIDHGAKIKIRD